MGTHRGPPAGGATHRGVSHISLQDFQRILKVQLCNIDVSIITITKQSNLLPIASLMGLIKTYVALHRHIVAGRVVG